MILYTPCGCISWGEAQREGYAWEVPIMNLKTGEDVRIAPKVGKKRDRFEVVFCPWCGKRLREVVEE